MRRLTIKGFKTAGFLLKAAASGMKSPPPCGDITPMEVVSNSRAEPQS